LISGRILAYFNTHKSTRAGKNPGLKSTGEEYKAGRSVMAKEHRGTRADKSVMAKEHRGTRADKSVMAKEHRGTRANKSVRAHEYKRTRANKSVRAEGSGGSTEARVGG
jgi:hypothetical protein